MRSSGSTSSRARARSPGAPSAPISSRVVSQRCNSSSVTTTSASREQSTHSLPGASWHRCRTRFMHTFLCRVPRSAQPFVATVVRTIFAQPSAEEVAAQLERVQEQLARHFPVAAELIERGAQHHRARALPRRPLAADLVEQPPGAPQPRCPPQTRRDRHLPGPRGNRAPRRHGARRASRRVGLGAALLQRWVPGDGDAASGRARSDGF